MFEQLVEKLPVGIGIVDENFLVVYLNDFFRSEEHTSELQSPD